MELIFITGNQNKADNATKLLGIPVSHHKLDLDEIQSLDLQEVVEHKLKQAYSIIKKPVIIEDVSLEFAELKRLPGTFIKFFVSELGIDGLCSLIGKNRKATAKCIIGYTDGKTTKFFEGKVDGEIVPSPRGSGGFGWDKVFMPNGFGGKTNAELNEKDYSQYYKQIRKFDLLKEFINTK